MEDNYVIRYEGIRLAKEFRAEVVFRYEGDNCYYFDEDHICRIREATELEKKNKDLYMDEVYGIFWLGKVEGSLEWKNYKPLDRIIAQKIKVGQKLEDVIYILIEECSVPQELENGVPLEMTKAFSRYFSFKRPLFYERISKNSKYYKTVVIEICLTSDVTREIIDKFRLALDKTVTEKIEGTRQFRMLDHPLSNYELVKAELSADASLFYDFTIKTEYYEEILGL